MFVQNLSCPQHLVEVKVTSIIASSQQFTENLILRHPSMLNISQPGAGTGSPEVASAVFSASSDNVGTWSCHGWLNRMPTRTPTKPQTPRMTDLWQPECIGPQFLPKPCHHGDAARCRISDISFYSNVAVVVGVTLLNVICWCFRPASHGVVGFDQWR